MPGLSKAELFEVVVDAVGESGWNVLYIAPPSTHPFQLEVYRGDEGYRLRILHLDVDSRRRKCSPG